MNKKKYFGSKNRRLKCPHVAKSSGKTWICIYPNNENAINLGINWTSLLTLSNNEYILYQMHRMGSNICFNEWVTTVSLWFGGWTWGFVARWDEIRIRNATYVERIPRSFVITCVCAYMKRVMFSFRNSTHFTQNRLDPSVVGLQRKNIDKGNTKLQNYMCFFITFFLS